MTRPLPKLCALALCGALALSACGDDEDKQSSTGASAQTTSTSADPPKVPRCRKVAKPAAKTGKAARPGRPALKLDPKATHDVILTTSCGEITIRLDVKRAPKTAASFASLASKDFYDGLIFHRISPGFVVQGGDPQGTGQGGPGYKVVEAPPTDLAYTKGVVAMAKTEIEDPGTSGSQFFIVTVDDSGLDPQYALVGKVVRGQDTVDLIGTAQIDPATEQPVNPIVIRSAELKTTKAPAAAQKTKTNDE